MSYKQYMYLKDHNQHWRMPAAYLKVLLQNVVSQDLQVGELLTGTALEASELMQSNQAVSFLETRQVVANVTRSLGPGWHLSLAQHLTISSHGPLGFAAVTAPDLRASVDVLLRFFGIRGPFLWLALPHLWRRCDWRSRNDGAGSVHGGHWGVSCATGHNARCSWRW
ncbi:MAG: hypothetical protein GQ538_04980 [Xanthomonadales bacterium]|nr:hypothetical protein [Xanthomonadales bacterium]